MLTVVCLLVVTVLAICYRPLLFATVDPEVAAARGVPVRALGIVFAALMGVVAARVVVAPVAAIATSVVFAEVSAVGGILLSLAPGVPVSVFVATISFVIYLICWLLRRRR